MAVLLAGLVSVSVAVTVAVFVMVPGVGGAWTTIVTVALAPLLMVPRLPVTVLPAVVTVPWLGVAETNVTPAGNVSVRVTPVAALGPLLATVTMYVRVCPARTGSGESVL